jgi:hypothetical protein
MAKNKGKCIHSLLDHNKWYSEWDIICLAASPSEHCKSEDCDENSSGGDIIKIKVGCKKQCVQLVASRSEHYTNRKTNITDCGWKWQE